MKRSQISPEAASIFECWHDARLNLLALDIRGEDDHAAMARGLASLYPKDTLRWQDQSADFFHRLPARLQRWHQEYCRPGKLEMDARQTADRVLVAILAILLRENTDLKLLTALMSKFGPPSAPSEWWRRLAEGIVPEFKEEMRITW